MWEEEHVALTNACRGDMLKSTQVAQLFGVNPKTVNRWADTGQLPFVRTLGGHRRYPREAVMAKLRGEMDAREPEVPPSA